MVERHIKKVKEKGLYSTDRTNAAAQSLAVTDTLPPSDENFTPRMNASCHITFKGTNFDFVHKTK